jgi:hypothetical protein
LKRYALISSAVNGMTPTSRVTVFKVNVKTASTPTALQWVNRQACNVRGDVTGHCESSRPRIRCRPVAEARNFQPPLKTFSIVTTAPVGKPLQDHARKIPLEHETQGLFKVFVTGWSELYRRLTQHDELVTKHYGLFTLSDVRQGLASVQQSVSEAAKTATEQHERTTDHLGDLTQAIAALSESNPPLREVPSFDPLEGAIAEAIERDFASRYTLAMRRSLFPEANKSEALQDLATELLAKSGFLSF